MNNDKQPENIKIDIDQNYHKLYLILAKNAPSTIEICNLLGQKLFEKNYDSNQIDIDISVLNTEVYLLKINHETFKFIP